MNSIAHEIWDMKYRFKRQDGTPVDQAPHDTWMRVAHSLAQPERDEDRQAWAARFYEAMYDFKFLPAGRIIAGAGTDRRVTLFNCFVMGTIDDSMTGIFDALKEAALTMQQGGGVGMDFSTIRFRGAPVVTVGSDASGPLSFMDCWDAMCRTIMSAGTRRGAMMGTLRCDHPDIEDFIEAKRDQRRLRNFNLSVLVTDKFMQCVKADGSFPLMWNGEVVKRAQARDLWDKIMRATYDVAEPGVIFIDRVNATNNLEYCETIAATNPCGEEPLPPYGACLLGSINLTRFVYSPFSMQSGIDMKGLDATVRTAIRMMDNVIEVSGYPLPQQEEEARAKRRLGLGVTGLADMLAMRGYRYGTQQAADLTSQVMHQIAISAYSASASLAEEKGSFPLYDRDAYLAPGKFPTFVKSLIEVHGIRNSHLLAIAPTGTISLFAGNVSSGIEPIFATSYERKVLQSDGSKQTHVVKDYAVELFEQLHHGEELPDYFVTAADLTPYQHLLMQHAAQRHVDTSISKTINCPADIGFESFKDVYFGAYEMGLKGCTTYRPNDVTGSVLSVASAKPTASTAPPPRDPVLEGKTYKFKHGDSEHAIYVTINDAVTDGQRRPFEVFINSKNMEHYAWTVALTRMISAVFRRGGDVAFVHEELKAVFDPRGGAWSDGEYIPSVVAAIGSIIEKHLGVAVPVLATGASGRQCPKCGAATLIKQEGCDVCTSCTYSKCG